MNYKTFNKSIIPPPFLLEDIPLYSSIFEDKIFAKMFNTPKASLPNMLDAVKFFLEYDDTEFGKCQLEDYVEGMPYTLTDNEYKLVIEYISAVDVFRFTLQSLTNGNDSSYNDYSAVDLLDALDSPYKLLNDYSAVDLLDALDSPYKLLSANLFCKLLRRLEFWDI